MRRTTLARRPRESTQSLRRPRWLLTKSSTRLIRGHAESAQRLPNISLAERIKAAAGKSTNIELSTSGPLGGNGLIPPTRWPVLIESTYLAPWDPTIHPVFSSWQRAKSTHRGTGPHRHGVRGRQADVRQADSIERGELTNIQERFATVSQHFSNADLVAFVNWTMIPHMTEI